MGSSKRDHTMIDINEGIENRFASSIENINPDNSLRLTKSCIFKIPTILFRHNEKAFVPNAFSIGPMHHRNTKLKDTEKIKLQYLHSLITRAPTTQTSLRNFIEAIRNLEKEARECYAVLSFDFSIEELVYMLVLDGCFIIELLRKDADEVSKDVPNDPIFDVSCMLQYLHHDLLLLENQIPWLVLDCLFKMTTVPNKKSLAQLVIEFFGSSFSMDPLPMVGVNHGSKHILDLLRNSLTLSLGGKRGDLYAKWQQTPSATSLAEAGIKFKKHESNKLLDIKFRNGVLEIPPLLVQETTNVAIRNLISFEQCYHKCTSKITSYAILLDNLVNTTKDLNILHQNGIIENWLNPEEAIQFFNKLYHDTYVKEFYYLDLSVQLHDHCQRNWPRWRAMLVRNHFSDPWAIVSLLFVGIVVLLTFLQTLYTIKKP